MSPRAESCADHPERFSTGVDRKGIPDVRPILFRFRAGDGGQHGWIRFFRWIYFPGFLRRLMRGCVAAHWLHPGATPKTTSAEPVGRFAQAAAEPEQVQRCCQTKQKSLGISPTPASIRPSKVGATR